MTDLRPRHRGRFTTPVARCGPRPGSGHRFHFCRSSSHESGAMEGKINGDAFADFVGSGGWASPTFPSNRVGSVNHAADAGAAITFLGYQPAGRDRGPLCRSCPRRLAERRVLRSMRTSDRRDLGTAATGPGHLVPTVLRARHGCSLPGLRCLLARLVRAGTTRAC